MGEQRTTNIMRRGEFLNKGPQVEAATPSILHSLPEDLPRNRLGFAQWLVRPENPLVARVTVNRRRAEVFGRGIDASLEDFGTQGDRPTHPQLLDWLAVEFVESGWSMKHLHKLIGYTFLPVHPFVQWSPSHATQTSKYEVGWWQYTHMSAKYVYISSMSKVPLPSASN